MDLVGKIYSLKFFSRIFHTVRYCLIRELRGLKRVLDLGCGPDSLIQYAPGIEYSLGVEGYAANLAKSKNKKIHSEYCLEKIENFKVGKKSFEAVVLIEVIEHLSKEAGKRVLGEAQGWATQKIILTTPNGFVEQGGLFGNLLEKHVSGWTVRELRDLGFKVRGLAGFKFLRQARCVASKDDNLLSSIRWKPRFFWFVIAAFSQLFIYYMPSLAFELLAVRQIKDE